MLSNIWRQQQDYNQKIFALENTNDREHWSRQYLLGLTAQVGEILDEIKWKRNRNESDKKAIPLNVLEEIADIAKFTISLAQVWGFSEHDFLNAIYEKGEILDFKLRMEFKEPLIGKKILITDIDGTLADYKFSFLRWLHEVKNITPSAEATTLLLDSTLEIRYPEYYELKQEFEETGGYRDLLIYSDVIMPIRDFHASGGYIIAVTARPAKIYKRIFKDTIHWFNLNNLPLDELYMQNEERILLADMLSKDNYVAFWEDNPEIIQRASKSGIKTFARKHAYNAHLTDMPNVQIIDKYEGVNTWLE